MEEQTRHRITQLTAENIKKLRAVSLSLKDGVTVIAGRNGQGKTSALDSLMWLLMGKRHPDPKILRDGEVKGFVEVETEDLIIKRTITAGGGGSLSIKPKEGKGGAYAGPQGFLDEIIGRNCFDPLAFMRTSPKPQAAQLRELVGLDFTELDADYQSFYESRTDVNREQKALAAEVEGMEYDADATEKKDPKEARDRIEKINTINREVMATKAELDKLGNSIDSLSKTDSYLGTRIENLESELEGEKKEQAKIRDEIDQRNQEFSRHNTAFAKLEAAVPDMNEALNDLQSIETHNANVIQTERRKELAERRDEKRRESDRLTRDMEKLEREKADALKSAEFPIEGLSFTGEGVTFNGLPLAQASGAEQIRVAVAISAAMNPAMPVMIVKDGSLLDSDSMKLLIELAEERDLQILVERIEQDEFVSIVIEDGEVVEKPDASNTPTDQGTLTLES